MKSFFTTFLAVLSAFVALFLLLTFGLVGFALSSSEEDVKVKSNTLLKISLNGSLEERLTEDPFSDLEASFLGMGDETGLGLRELRIGLEAAKTDPNIEGILLEQGAFSSGYAMLEELAEYLEDFKTSGKKIYSYGEYYTQKGAFVSTLADSIIVHPGGVMDVRGIGISSTYYKAFFDKFGIEPLVVRGTGNKFKSAVEPYISEEMSEENRLQLTHLTESLWNFIAQSYQKRGVSRERMDSLAANWVGMDAHSAAQLGLADATGYREDVLEDLERRFEILAWSDYVNSLSDRNTATDRIALIYANGSIGNGSGDENTIGTENIIKALKKANENDKVKAIVLRVNSPGGSAITSDMIHHTIASIEKPVVVSQANYAASGGYYISCNADAIFTNSTTVTGSIGIFMSLFTAEKLMEQTLGLRVEEVKTHPLANFPNLAKQPSQEQYAILQHMIDQGYDDFTSKVAEGRDTTIDYVKTIGGGRVWMGSDAIEIGLADQEGNLKDALAYAATLAGVSAYRVYELPVVEDGIQKLLKEFGKVSATNNAWSLFKDHPAAEDLKFMIENPGIQARIHPAFLGL